MKRLSITSLCAALVVLTLFMAFHQDAPADETLEQRVAALETRVTALEDGETPTSAPATPRADRPDAYSTEGDASGVVGPFAIAEGRHRFSFQCEDPSGIAILSDKDGNTSSVISKDGNMGESILMVGKNAVDLYVEVHCDSHWTYAVSPL